MQYADGDDDSGGETPTYLQITAIFSLLVIALLGGIFPVYCRVLRESRLGLGCLNAFAGGIFLSLALNHLLPDAIKDMEIVSTSYPLPFSLALGGYILLLFLEKIFFDTHSVVGHAHAHTPRPNSNNHDHAHGSDLHALSTTAAHVRAPSSHSFGQTRQSSYFTFRDGRKKEPPQPQKGNPVAPHLTPDTGATDLLPANPNAAAPGTGSIALILNSGSLSDPDAPERNPLLPQSSVQRHHQAAAIDSIDMQRQADSPANASESECTHAECEHSYRYHDGRHDGHGHHPPHPKYAGEIAEHASHPHTHSVSSTYLLLLALSVHSIFEGIALGVQDEKDLFWELFIGIAVHKGAEAIALAASFLKNHGRNRKTISLLCLFSLASPLGIVIGMAIASTGSHITVGIFTSLAAGTFLYVSTTEIAAEEFTGGQRRDRGLKFVCFLLGVGLICGLTLVDLNLEN